MRTLRLSLVWTVILALLGGVGSGVMAQNDAAPADGPALVSGTMEFPRFAVTGPYRFEEGMVVYEETTEIPILMDDPRLSGNWRARWMSHEFRGSGDGVFTAAVEISNDHGSWSGSAQGYFPGYGPYEYEVVLAGRGTYDGQSALLFVRENPDVGPDSIVTGIVFTGTLPPTPDTVEAPAE